MVHKNIEEDTSGYVHYLDYMNAISPYISQIKENISKAPKEEDVRIIRMKIRDIASKMGPRFEKISDSSIYWALKYILSQEGILVKMEKSIEGDMLLAMRLKTDKDIHKGIEEEKKYLKLEEKVRDDIIEFLKSYNTCIREMSEEDIEFAGKEIHSISQLIKVLENLAYCVVDENR